MCARSTGKKNSIEIFVRALHCTALHIPQCGPRFAMLYKRKFYLHHYTEYMEEAGFEGAWDEVRTLIDGYRRLEATPPPEVATRYQPV